MKRIICCCDGTWQVSHNSNPSNVALLSRSIRPYVIDNGVKVDQLLYYQKGVGTNPCLMERLLGGMVGEGINDNIGCAYVSICLNWCPGDEIYLFGFSRGAYSVRALAGLICQYGLLTRRALEGTGIVYGAYLKNDLTLSPDTVKELSSRFPRIENVPIKFIGVWDTVGSMGVPDFYIWGWKLPGIGRLSRSKSSRHTHQFRNTELHSNIEYAMHALAINERRAPFSPTLWTLSPNNKVTTLKQVWFPGVHGSVGGGLPDHGISNITLSWMVQQLQTYTDLEIDIPYLLEVRSAYGDEPTSVPWGCGTWRDSVTGVFRISGVKSRTPGKYFTENYRTNELVHKSVGERVKRLGSKYRSPDLSCLEEDELGDIEKELSLLEQ